MQCVGVPLMESIRQYEEGNYEEAVNLLYPVRYNITKLGGSDAQVDQVFTLKSRYLESKEFLNVCRVLTWIAHRSGPSRIISWT